ncbi:MAG TPA: GDP-mannose 4,6-dehydratase [Pyrinomonadaceae bacterium]|nr:GDP-mannose 4,6-dehydratase [Pyrinomonadaceae bacterium]
MKRRILITGGAGFIGSHLVQHLVNEGNWHVTVIDDFNDFYEPAVKRENIAPFQTNENFTLFELDIRDYDDLKETFTDCQFDLIVHLAARAGVRPSLEQPHLYTEANVIGTLNLLELARHHKVRQFVFGSSSSVYGANAKVPFSEDDPVRAPISPYAATKAAGELLCHTYSYLYQIRCVCLRFFTVYGARQRPDLAIHKFARLMSAGRPIPVFGDGTTRRDYTFIDDIMQGVRAAMDFDASIYEVINLGESRTVQLNELIQLLERELGVDAIIERKPLQPGDVPATFANIEKARRLLAYEPQTQIEDGIARFVKWFRESS